MPLDGRMWNDKPELPLPASVVALDKARALLGPNGENWIQGADNWAHDRKSRAVSEKSPTACRFCSAAAYVRVVGNLSASDDAHDGWVALSIAAGEIMGVGEPAAPFAVNDTRPWPDVARMWSRAREILMAEARARETVL